MAHLCRGSHQVALIGKTAAYLAADMKKDYGEYDVCFYHRFVIPSACCFAAINVLSPHHCLVVTSENAHERDKGEVKAQAQLYMGVQSATNIRG